jgi:hypothetical protein
MFVREGVLPALLREGEGVLPALFLALLPPLLPSDRPRPRCTYPAFIRVFFLVPIPNSVRASEPLRSAPHPHPSPPDVPLPRARPRRPRSRSSCKGRPWRGARRWLRRTPRTRAQPTSSRSAPAPRPASAAATLSVRSHGPSRTATTRYIAHRALQFPSPCAPRAKLHLPTRTARQRPCWPPQQRPLPDAWPLLAATSISCHHLASPPRCSRAWRRSWQRRPGPARVSMLARRT